MRVSQLGLRNAVAARTDKQDILHFCGNERLLQFNEQCVSQCGGGLR